MSAALERLRAEGLGALDLELAELLARLCPAAEHAAALALGAALASFWRRQRHACLPLAEVAGAALERAADPRWGERAPALAEWCAALLASGLVARHGEEEARLPLVLDVADRLYLQRMDHAESQVAAHLTALLEPLAPPPGLPSLLAERAAALDPEQREALRAAFSRRLAVLTGGPGTGKTSVLGLLLELAGCLEPDLRIALAAPTGRAAARMQEAVGGTHPTRTLHRLLLERPPLDWLVVDEASMVDLPLMARALELLPEDGRLLLIGDADQLASVEAGAVLAGIRDGLSALPAPEDATPALIRLRRSRRFPEGSGIGALAAAAREGDAEGTLELLAGGAADLAWIRPRQPDAGEALARTLEEGWRPFLEAAGGPAALGALESFRVLCAARRGRLGVEGINGWCRRRWAGPDGGREPLLVRANDPALGLANGDSGVREPGADGARCWLAAGGAPRALAPSQLPAHDAAWAITVHQSQGAEMDEVLLILPEAPSPLLCRELLYTGVTRARRRLTVVAGEEALRLAVTQRLERSGGLADRLRERLTSV